MPDDKVMRCDCGYEVIAADEDGLTEGIRRHAWSAHGVAFSTEEALLVVFRSQLEPDRASSQRGVRETRTPEGGST